MGKKFTSRILLVVIACLLAQMAGYAGITFKVNLYSVSPGAQIVVPVTVEQFDSITSCQGTIGFDTTVLSFVDVEQLGIPGMTNTNFGTTQAGTGKLTYSWNDNTLNGVYLADSTIIFAIRFNVIGNSGQFSPINFLGSPTALEVVDVHFNTLNPVYTNGRVTVSAVFSTLKLKIDTVISAPGVLLGLAVRVWNFNNILSLQGTIDFDTAILSFDSVAQMGLPGMTNANFGAAQTGAGKLTYSWNDATLAGVSLADSSVIFAIRFNVTGINGQFSHVNFVNAPTPLEVVDSDYNTLNPAYNNGLVTISATSGGLALKTDAAASAKIYPNPNRGSFIIELNPPSEQNLFLKIMNPIGQQILGEEYPSMSGLRIINIDMAEHGAGNYIVEMQTSNGILTKKVMIE